MHLGRTVAATIGILALAAPATTAVAAPPGDNNGKKPPKQSSTVPDFTPQMWNLEDIGSPAANEVVDGRGITVAVIDTGVDVDHPEFKGRIVDPVSWICPEGVEVPCQGAEYADDGHGHGTHVAGTVAAADDGAGVTGVAPAADVMPVRVGDDEGSISGDLVAAMRYATAAGADVITMSIGYIAGTGPIFDNPVAPVDEWNQAVTEAQEAGILVTLAAGNDAVPYCGQGETWQDAALCVGAYGTEDDPAVYSDWGYEIDINAPGGGVLTCAGGILSTVPLDQQDSCYETGGYGVKSGTSMATPHVAGVGALLAQQGITGAEAAQRIVDTARTDVPVTLPGATTGPRLDAAAAVGAS